MGFTSNKRLMSFGKEALFPSTPGKRRGGNVVIRGKYLWNGNGKQIFPGNLWRNIHAREVPDIQSLEWPVYDWDREWTSLKAFLKFGQDISDILTIKIK